MLFGYDTGIISAVLIYIHSDLGRELQSNEKELIASLCSGGAFVGAIFAGLTADKYGRKGGYLCRVRTILKVIWLCCVIANENYKDASSSPSVR